MSEENKTRPCECTIDPEHYRECSCERHTKETLRTQNEELSVRLNYMRGQFQVQKDMVKSLNKEIERINKDRNMLINQRDAEEEVAGDFSIENLKLKSEKADLIQILKSCQEVISNKSALIQIEIKEALNRT